MSSILTMVTFYRESGHSDDEISMKVQPINWLPELGFTPELDDLEETCREWIAENHIREEEIIEVIFKERTIFNGGPVGREFDVIHSDRRFL